MQQHLAGKENNALKTKETKRTMHSLFTCSLNHAKAGSEEQNQEAGEAPLECSITATESGFSKG